MIWSLPTRGVRTPPAPAPVLDLSGPKLRAAFENLVDAAEPSGGVERYVGALALKASLFDELLAEDRGGSLTETEFCDLAAFITPARRRIGLWLSANEFEALRRRIETLLRGDADTAESRIAAFAATFPSGRDYRWTRDLAAELLHFSAPERYPLMTRWVWDARVNTGVIREIWHSDAAEIGIIAIPDGLATFQALRDELSEFLRSNGVFRELPFYVDLIAAHIYAGYINDTGGHYLQGDFCGGAKGDAMAHTRRLLGLDAVDSDTGRTRLKLIDGHSHVLGEPRRLGSS